MNILRLMGFIFSFIVSSALVAGHNRKSKTCPAYSQAGATAGSTLVSRDIFAALRTALDSMHE